MTLLTIMGVIEILCSFRLVIEGKKFVANTFAFSDEEDNISRLFNGGDIADLP